MLHPGANAVNYEHNKRHEEYNIGTFIQVKIFFIDITICFIVKLNKSLYAVFVQIENYSGFNLTLPYDDVVCGYNKESGDKVMDEFSISMDLNA